MGIPMNFSEGIVYSLSASPIRGQLPEPGTAGASLLQKGRPLSAYLGALNDIWSLLHEDRITPAHAESAARLLRGAATPSRLFPLPPNVIFTAAAALMRAPTAAAEREATAYLLSGLEVASPQLVAIASGLLSRADATALKQLGRCALQQRNPELRMTALYAVGAIHAGGTVPVAGFIPVKSPPPSEKTRAGALRVLTAAILAGKTPQDRKDALETASALRPLPVAVLMHGLDAHQPEEVQLDAVGRLSPYLGQEGVAARVRERLQSGKGLSSSALDAMAFELILVNPEPPPEALG